MIIESKINSQPPTNVRQMWIGISSEKYEIERANTTDNSPLPPLAAPSALHTWAMNFAAGTDSSEAHDIAAIAAYCQRIGAVTSGPALLYNIPDLLDFADTAAKNPYRSILPERAKTIRRQWRALHTMLCHIQAAAKPIL